MPRPSFDSVLAKTRRAGLVVAMGLCLGPSSPVSAQDFNEKYCPQFHSSPPKGWMNAPNGLVYCNGEYHLFYQHNPSDPLWIQRLSWGHAISPDLVHWEHLPVALPPEDDTKCGSHIGGAWSGSGFVDEKNTLGIQAGNEKTILLTYMAMSPQCGQHLAYSTDRGRTFTTYEGNPVIPAEAEARDPYVFWDAPRSRWSMTYWVGAGFVFFSSNDLKIWTSWLRTRKGGGQVEVTGGKGWWRRPSWHP